MCVSLTSTAVGQVLSTELGGLLLVITLTWRWIFGPERKSVDPKKPAIRALAGDGRGSGYFICPKWKAPGEEAGRAL